MPEQSGRRRARGPAWRGPSQRLEDPAQAVVELDLRLPPELGARTLDRQAAAPDLAGRAGANSGSASGANDSSAPTSRSASIRSSTDVSRPWPMLTGPSSALAAASRLARTTSETSTQSRVWRPSPNTVGRPTLEQMAAEDRHDPGLAVHVLARAVDVAVAQRDRREADAGASTARSSPRRRTCSARRARAAGSDGPPGVGSTSASP